PSCITVPSAVPTSSLSLHAALPICRTLHRNGRRFLVEVMAEEALADSVNHLLLVGFYLVNIGVAALLVNAAGELGTPAVVVRTRSEEHTSELQSHLNLVCRLLLEKK